MLGLLGTLRDVAALPYRLWLSVVHTLPGPRGDRMRHRYWRRRLGHLGRGVRISEGAWFQGAALVSIGDNTWIDRNVLVIAGAPAKEDRTTKHKPNDSFPLGPGEVRIGSGVHISPDCVLSGIAGLYIGDNVGFGAGAKAYSTSAHYRNLVDETDRRQYAYTPRAPRHLQSMVSSPIFVDDFCGVAPNALVLPGTRLEKGTWSAAGTTVRGRWGPQVLVSQGPKGLEAKPFEGLDLPK